MNIKSFAELKRFLQPGVVLTLVRHDWYPNGPLINKPRKICKIQSNAIAFEPIPPKTESSWLHWGKSSEYTIDEKGFNVQLTPDDPEKIMRYEFSK